LLALGSLRSEGDLVFTRQNGVALDPDVVSQRFQEAVALSGVRRIRLHDLRHTHATQLLKNGTPAHVVSQRLGHSDVTSTLRQNAHVLPDQQAEATRMLAAEVDGSVQDPSVRHQQDVW
jgi:integrase